MVSGFVTSVQGAEIVNKIVVVANMRLLAADERSSCRHLDCRRKWYTNMRQEKGTNIV